MIRLSAVLAVIGVFLTLTNANAEPKVAWSTLTMSAICGLRAEVKEQVRLGMGSDLQISGVGISGLGHSWELWTTKDDKWVIVSTAPNVSEDTCVLAGNDEPGSWYKTLVEETK